MSNLGLHEFCRKNGIDLVCTNVGDRNVLEKMVECGYKLGGEQSGHMIFTDYATTGDGQLSALQFLQILALSGKSASVLTADCPQYPQVLLNVVVSHDRGVKEAIMASDALKTAVADEEKFLRGEGRILVRPLRHRGAHPRDGRGQDRKRRAAGRRAVGEGHSIGLIRRFVGERATNEAGIVSCCPNFIFFSDYFRKYLTKPCKYRYNAVW